MRFLAVPTLLAAALAFACGGDDDNPASPGGSDSGGNGANATQPAGGATPASGGGGGVADNTAVVEVDGQRYEFTLLSCVQLGGALGAVGRASGGGDIAVNIDLPPPGWESNPDDWEPPYVRVRDDTKNVDWRAGGEVIGGFEAVGEGQSQVDSYQVDGKRASGTVTFVDLLKVMQGAVEPVQGTFEVACR